MSQFFNGKFIKVWRFLSCRIICQIEYLTEIKMRYDILNKAGIGQRDHIRGLFLKKLTKSALDHANSWAMNNNPNKRSIHNCCT